MPKPCNECGASQLPADSMDCEKALFICPNCAPDFVLMRATTFTDVECENDAWNDKY